MHLKTMPTDSSGNGNNGTALRMALAMLVVKLVKPLALVVIIMCKSIDSNEF